MDSETLETLTKSLNQLYGKHTELDQHQLGVYLDAICEALAEGGIRAVTVEYDGAGDEGWVHDPVYEPADAAVPEALSPLIVALVGVCLPPGWEINEGSSGTVVIDPESIPRARFSHVQRLEVDEPEPFTVAARHDPELIAICRDLARLGLAEVDFQYFCAEDGSVEFDFPVWSGTLPRDLEDRIEGWVTATLSGRAGPGRPMHGDGQIEVEREQARFDHRILHEESDEQPFSLD